MNKGICNLKSLLNYLLFLILLLNIQTGAAENKKVLFDQNHDGNSDGLNMAVDKGSTISSDYNSDLAIGIIDTGAYQVVSDRLQNLGFNNLTLLSANSNLASFSSYKVIYLPSGWAQFNIGNADSILAKSADYKQYVLNGGGLLVEQPNPYQLPGDSITVTLLPEPVTFHNLYTATDYPPVIVDTLHYITSGLSRNEVPFPGDQVRTLNGMYNVLVRGNTSGYPSLFVTEYGNGRVLVHTAHPSPSSLYPISDTVIVRMINWVSEGITSLAELNGIPLEQFQLRQNHPNPFNPTTIISYYLPITSTVELSIYNILGQKVRSLINRVQSAGEHQIEWDGRNEQGFAAGSGIYIYHFRGGKYFKTRKMLLVR